MLHPLDKPTTLELYTIANTTKATNASNLKKASLDTYTNLTDTCVSAAIHNPTTAPLYQITTNHHQKNLLFQQTTIHRK